MNKYNELKVKFTRFTWSFIIIIFYFASVLKFFMFITHRRQESLMPSSRGGVGRMLPKIIGTCHTDGMEMMHNIIFS
jgi:hypothetical protein